VTTLAIMKARIADELARDDLTTQIATAINDAIVAYQSERYAFSESRTRCVFNTVASQQDYNQDDNADIPYMLAIDYFALTVGSTVTMLERYRPEVIEDLSNNQSAVGEPYAYTYYKRTLRLYPIPGQVYACRVAGLVVMSAPAEDDTIGNVWMVEGERLIRSRAKLELAVHVLKDQGLATAMAGAVQEAESQLKSTGNRQTGSGRIVPTQF